MDRANITQLGLPLKNLVHLAESDYKEKPSIFLLHGFGSNMKDLFGLTPFFGEGWNCISLQASIQIQYDGWGWAELDPMNIRRLPKPEQTCVSKEKRKICKLVGINKWIDQI